MYRLSRKKNLKPCPKGMKAKTFHEVLTDVVQEFAEYGYSDPRKADEWIAKLRAALIAELPSADKLEQTVKAALRAVYRRRVEQGAALGMHPGVSRFTLDRIAPYLRDDLDRRILASADLIRLNRQRAIEQTIQRAAGWMTSVPAGGSRAIDKREVKATLSKPFRSMSYEERRVVIDQGHKLARSIDATIALQTGAIAMEWRSHWKQAGYDYREDHKERDKKIYAIRGNWAMEKGLMNKGAGYTDEMTQPGQEVFCRCWGRYLNNLRDLPDSMLTAKGRAVLSETRTKLRA